MDVPDRRCGIPNPSGGAGVESHVMRLVPVIAIENSAAVCYVEVVETQQATSHFVCVNLPGAAAPALLQPHSDLDGTRSFYSVVSPALHLSGWILGLVLTQMMMLVYGKNATSEAQLPLVLCFVQFATSALLAAAICAVRTGRLPWSPRELWVTICSLAGVWTAGFVLFNASTAVMSPSLVNVVRCMEPLATIVLGFAMGERYSVATLATLMPICGGVALASVRANVVRGTPHDCCISNLLCCLWCSSRANRCYHPPVWGSPCSAMRASVPGPSSDCDCKSTMRTRWMSSRSFSTLRSLRP